MPGKRIGYKRVSTCEQNPESQLIGIELDKVFVDIESGYSTINRQQLQNLKEYVRDDDVVFVECMDRLGRNGYDLDEIVEFQSNVRDKIYFLHRLFYACSEKLIKNSSKKIKQVLACMIDAAIVEKNYVFLDQILSLNIKFDSSYFMK